MFWLMLRMSCQWQPSGNGEQVIFGEVGQVFVAVDLHGGGVLFVVDVGDPLEENEREDVLLEGYQKLSSASFRGSPSNC